MCISGASQAALDRTKHKNSPTRAGLVEVSIKHKLICDCWVCAFVCVCVWYWLPWQQHQPSDSLLLPHPPSFSFSLFWSVFPPFTASNSTISRPPAYISTAQLVAGQASQLFQGDAAYGNHGDVTMLNPHVLHFINLTLLLLPHRTEEDNTNP